MIGLPYVTVTWVPRIFGKCASRISLDPEIESGMIGQPVFVAILNEPLWNSAELQLALRLAAGTLREDTDGSAALDLLTSGENHLQTLLDVGTVEKQAVDEFHPVL